MKGYKVFDSRFRCRDFQFEIGKTYTIEAKPELCQIGFHFCTKLADCFSYYSFSPTNIVCEIEAAGEITSPEKGGSCSKRACSQISIGRQLSWQEVLDLCNIGQHNSGCSNSGHHNSGNYNSGGSNSGNHNSGSYNSGDGNSGNCNSGHGNSGCRNTDDYNSGHYNSGHSNSGNYNSGDGNGGNYNSGNCNSGHRNSGNYNSSNFNSGHFNTTAPTVRMFNRDTGLQPDEIDLPWVVLPLTEWIPAANMTDQQKQDNPGYDNRAGFLLQRSYKEAWAAVWQQLSAAERQEFLNLPNFDAAVFEEITGIKTNKKKGK